MAQKVQLLGHMDPGHSVSHVIKGQSSYNVEGSHS